MNEEIKSKKEVVRIGGKLKEIITLFDASGKIVSKVISPLMVEFHLRDLLQIIVGATLLAMPIMFTQEVWELSETLPLNNVLAFAFLSVFFIAIFVYYNYYRKQNFLKHKFEFLKRVITTYIVSFVVVAFYLFLIQKAPFSTDWVLAFKRIILISFPASMSATIVDIIK